MPKEGAFCASTVSLLMYFCFIAKIFPFCIKYKRTIAEGKAILLVSIFVIFCKFLQIKNISLFFGTIGKSFNFIPVWAPCKVVNMFSKMSNCK